MYRALYMQTVKDATPYFSRYYIFVTFCLDMCACQTSNLNCLLFTRCFFSEFHILLVPSYLLIKTDLKTNKFIVFLHAASLGNNVLLYKIIPEFPSKFVPHLNFLAAGYGPAVWCTCTYTL